MDVTKIREQIPVCRKLTYVNTGWSGPSPLQVTQAIKDRLDYEMNDGPTTEQVYESGKEIKANTLEAVARFLNASPEEICLTQNTTDGLNIVINGLPWRSGDEIITCDLEHSSVLIPSYFQRKRYGVVVKVLSIAPDESQESILAKIQAALTERTRLVFLSHIEYSCGIRMPVEEIRKLTRDRGVLMLLDGAQTAGHLALDMKDIDCEFYSIPGQKWLLASEGVGALYMRKDMIPQVEPMKVAGRAVVSHEDPYEFEPETASMDKFLLSSTSSALYSGMLEAIKLIESIGVADIEQRNLDLASTLKDALRETPGVTVLSPMDRKGSSGLVSFAIDGVDPKDAVARMWERHKIVCRPVSYPSGIRVSLHFFNTEEEVSKVVEAVRELV